MGRIGTVKKSVLCLCVLFSGGTGVRAQDETDRRIADLKQAFEEITASFRQRMSEQEQNAERERKALATERDAARAQLAGEESTRKDLEEKLALRDAELASLRASQAGNADALRARDEQIARLQQALEAAEQSNARERFALAYNLGSIYKAARQYDRAETQFLKALAMNADDAALHYNLGILYDDNLGNAKKARRHYERFLELAPRDPDAPNVVKWLKEL